jgi:aminoglycoside phosphotransferase (APT) family kinase protein
MHAEELHVDAALVRRLLTEQFPEWAGLPIERVPSDGTVNAIFRLGDALAVRAPFVPGETGIRRQARWTPVLAPALPVPVPAVHGVGVPTPEYPSDWLVVDWLPGCTPAPGGLADPDAVTDALVDFIRALWAQDPTGAPDAHRWGGLARDDAAVRRALADIHEVDTDAVLRLWERALAMPVHERGVWVHDDLLPANLLVDDAGRLAAVIDFVPGAADPATVCLAAWNVLPASHRARFRAELGLDAAAWWRGIGWAIVQAVVALPYYRRTNAGMTRMARHALRELVAGATPLEPR